MALPKLTKLELQILEILWTQQKASIREIQEAFPEPRPAYTTVQTTVYRLETKKAVRRVRKISNAHIFEPIVARDAARHRLLDEILSFSVDAPQPMMAQLAEAGKLTMEDVRELENAIKKSTNSSRKQQKRDQNERFFDESPVAINAICGRRSAANARISQKSRTSSLLALVQCIG